VEKSRTVELIVDSPEVAFFAFLLDAIDCYELALRSKNGAGGKFLTPYHTNPELREHVRGPTTSHFTG
jgi:hypothetical protein